MSVSIATMLFGQYVGQIREERSLSLEENYTQDIVMEEANHTITTRIFYKTLSNDDIVVLILHCIIFLLALVGNGLVITTLIQNRRMRTVTNIFLLNLALSDLLLAIVCMPFTIIPIMMGQFIFGRTMCILIRYLQGVTVSASAFTLVAISLERFYAICNPIKSRKWQNTRHSYKVIASIWVAAMVLNIPMAIFQTLKLDGIHRKQCIDEWPNPLAKQVYYVFHLLIADLLVPLTIMSIAYGLIARNLWNGLRSMNIIDTMETTSVKAKRQMSLTSEASDVSDDSEMPLNGGPITPTSPSCTSPTEATKFVFSPTINSSHAKKVMRQETVASMRSHSSRQTVQSKKRVIKMLFVIVVEFFVCWTPLYLIMLGIILDYDAMSKFIKNPKYVISGLRLLAYASSCCNPITYCFMSKKFRAAFRTAFRCRKETKKLPTYQNTQVSYCENGHPLLKSKLSSLTIGHNKQHLSVLPEATCIYDRG